MIRARLPLATALVALALTAPVGAAPDIAAPAPAPAAESAPSEPTAALQPYALVRTLQTLQERIAEGDVEAHRAQRPLIAAIAERFAAADPAAWADPRNARAAIAFVLGGGPPQSLSSILAAGVPFGADRTTAQGALAFLQGRTDEARAAFVGLDAMSVGGPLGAQLAMAQSALAVRDDPAESMRLLAVARLLAPGTLVEEAALRREIFVAGQSGALERLEFLAVQYLRRFRHSIYAGNFRQRFAVLLTALDFDGDLERFARLETMLARFDAESRRDMYLFFARHSLINGRTAVARRASTLAHGLSAGGSDAEERATFYAAVSQIATDRFALAADTLTDLDAGKLPEADRLLLEAALDLAVQIGAPMALAPTEMGETEGPAATEETEPLDVVEASIVADDTVPTPVAPDPADAAPTFEPPAATPAMRRAVAALDAIDLMLTESRR